MPFHKPNKKVRSENNGPPHSSNQTEPKWTTPRANWLDQRLSKYFPLSNGQAMLRTHSLQNSNCSIHPVFLYCQIPLTNGLIGPIESSPLGPLLFCWMVFLAVTFTASAMWNKVTLCLPYYLSLRLISCTASSTKSSKMSFLSSPLPHMIQLTSHCPVCRWHTLDHGSLSVRTLYLERPTWILCTINWFEGQLQEVLFGPFKPLWW